MIKKCFFWLVLVFFYFISYVNYFVCVLNYVKYEYELNIEGLDFLLFLF